MSTDSVRFKRARQIGDFVRERPGTSMIELEGRFPWFRGDMEWASRDDSNLVFWVGLSRDFVEAVQEAEGLGLVHREPTQLLTYLADGGGLSLPLAKGSHRGQYKVRHWLPVVLVPGQVTAERVKQVNQRRVRKRELRPAREQDVTRNGVTFTEGDRPEEEAIDRSLRWIRSHTIPTKAPPSGGATSYGYKHKVERGCTEHGIAEGYVPNGAFIVAAIRAGARVYHLVGTTNAVFNFKLDPKRSCAV